MNLMEVLLATKDRSAGSDKYMWECFGTDAHIMDFKDTDGSVYASAVFDIRTQTVYSINVEVPGYPQAFLWLAEDTKKAYYAECSEREIDPNIAWDNVNFTHVVTEELILQYLKDVGEGYYDNLPVPPDQIPTLTDEVEKDPPFTMPMPGTIGGAKFTFGDGFQNEKKMIKTYKVNLDVRMVFDVDADSMDEAVTKARQWQEESKTTWGGDMAVSWVDHYVVKESVELDTSQD